MARATDPSPPNATDRLDAAAEIARREALRSGRPLRAVLSLVRITDPPTQPEKLLLAAVRLLGSPHAIMPHRCKSLQEWLAKYAPDRRHP
jgi:hypothetical protein